MMQTIHPSNIQCGDTFLHQLPHPLFTAAIAEAAAVRLARNGACDGQWRAQAPRMRTPETCEYFRGGAQEGESVCHQTQSRVEWVVSPRVDMWRWEDCKESSRLLLLLQQKRVLRKRHVFFVYNGHIQTNDLRGKKEVFTIKTQ